MLVFLLFAVLSALKLFAIATVYYGGTAAAILVILAFYVIARRIDATAAKREQPAPQ